MYFTAIQKTPFRIASLLRILPITPDTVLAYHDEGVHCMKRPYTFKTVELPVKDTIPQRMRKNLDRLADFPMQKWNDKGKPAACSYREFWDDVIALAVALKRQGVRRGHHVGIISDNRREWLRIDLAALSIGAIDVPRGSDTTEEEITYILRHADCEIVFAENAKIAKRICARLGDIPTLKKIILIQDDRDFCLPAGSALSLAYMSEYVAEGKTASATERADIDADIDATKPTDVATIIYTSGTTGEPKGVLLPHASFIFQLDNIYNYLHLHHWDTAITVLPVWHSYERAVEYIIIERGLALVYSRPVGSIMLDDMAMFHPTILPAVPRLMESVMQGVNRTINKKGGLTKLVFHAALKVGGAFARCRNLLMAWVPAFTPRCRPLDFVLGLFGLILLAPWELLSYLLVFKSLHQKFGGKLCSVIVGGGALPKNVDDFYQAIGVKCLEGYGLTETGPILTVRQMHAPVVGTIGPIFDTARFEVRSESGEVLGPGQRGILFINSPQNMLGYYKRDDETKKVMDEKGWLNTGDLAMYSYGKVPYVKIIGRIKDTIVLRGGKNVEPEPIEQKINSQNLVDQSVVVGQDQKFLAALIVPNRETLGVWAKARGLDTSGYPELIKRNEVLDLYQELVEELISKKNGFKSYELIFRIALIEKPFEVGREMTQSLKLKRHVIQDEYEGLIAGLFTQA
jgi:long-chain acyl-CoA synthetase